MDTFDQYEPLKVGLLFDDLTGYKAESVLGIITTNYPETHWHGFYSFALFQGGRYLITKLCF